jgi:hypothetical protein
MKKIKIVEVGEERLVFSDGVDIYSFHEPDCCEYNYADFSQIDDIAKEWEFIHPIIFERCEYGFRFGNKNKMVFVPCYSNQSGYYSYSVDIYYKGGVVLKSVTCEDR